MKTDWNPLMENIAYSFFSDEPESLDAGKCAGEALIAHFGPGGPKATLVYATMNHDQPALLEGLRSTLGEGSRCSVVPRKAWFRTRRSPKTV